MNQRLGSWRRIKNVCLPYLYLMTNFIPLFPLNIVVFPGEIVNLHIFEPRYKQLIKDCFIENKLFGIPSVMNEEISEMGCSIRILEIAKEYEDGKMDIKTEALQVFRILEHIREIPDKSYSGAIVTYPENNLMGIPSKMEHLLQELQHFHTLLDVHKEYGKARDQLSTYDIAHHIGLSTTEEYEFLCLLREDQRQEYLQRHLRKTIPTILELQRLKERIKLNGHFRRLSAE